MATEGSSFAHSTSKRPRVLFLADHLGHPGGVFHGVTTYLLQVIPALRDAGVEVGACFLRDFHPAAHRLQACGIQPIFLNASSYDLRTVMKIGNIVRSGGFSVLQVTQMQSSLLARILGRSRNLRVVLQIHDLTLPPAYARLLYRLTKLADERALCVSEAARRIAIDGYGVKPENVSVLYPGVDIRRFDAIAPGDRDRIRHELRVASNEPLIAMAARFDVVKGHAAMLRIFAQLLRDAPESVLALAGDGPEHQACRELAERLGLQERVRFLGQRHDIPEIMFAADVIAIPSEREGIALSAVEGNLAGRPVVAFRTGGLPEAIRADVCGTLIAPADEAGFAQAVLAWLPRAQDPLGVSKRKQIAAERFALEHHVRRLLEIHTT